MTRFSHHAAPVLAAMVDELAQAIHVATRHASPSWRACERPYCLAVRAKALSVVEADSPEGPACVHGVGLTYDTDGNGRIEVACAGCGHVFPSLRSAIEAGMGGGGDVRQGWHASPDGKAATRRVDHVSDGPSRRDEES